MWLVERHFLCLGGLVRWFHAEVWYDVGLMWRYGDGDDIDGCVRMWMVSRVSRWMDCVCLRWIDCIQGTVLELKDARHLPVCSLNAHS